MPITAIILQPAQGSINAAYRPIVYRVVATKTDGTATPPVVYCDIYFNGIYYRSRSKTQPIANNAGVNTTWEFDIQDACQEFLHPLLGENGGVGIINVAPSILQTFVKFRSSGIDLSGFVLPEGTAPVQGTGSTAPISGTGTQSDVSLVLNATLQHPSNPDLAVHLSAFKTGTWASEAWPLSHRLPGFAVSDIGSEYFPIVYTGSGVPDCIKLSFRIKGQTNFTSINNCGGACVPVQIVTSYTPTGNKDKPYSGTVVLSGDAPFVLSNVTSPSWMVVQLAGSNVTLTGTPNAPGTNLLISFTVTNCQGANSVNFSTTINVLP